MKARAPLFRFRKGRSLPGAIQAILSLLLVSGCAYVNVSVLQPMRPLEEQVIEGEGRPKILILDVSGFISETERSDRLKIQKRPSQVAEMREALRKAEKDRDMTGVIVRIHSPGGTVTASDIIYHELMNFRKRKKVPLYACITGMGTSGAYYIAAAADRVYAHPAAITGSIGVIAMKFNVEGLMGKLGIEEETVKSGDKKDLFSPFRELTPEERQIVQSIIDELHQRFVGVVLARQGGVLVRQDIEALADGRIYTAGTALAEHLIDEIAYLDDVIAHLKESAGIEEARVVSYTRHGEYQGSIYASLPARELSLLQVAGESTGSIAPLSGVSFLYLWSP